MKRIKSTPTRIYNEVKAEQFLSKYLKISNGKLTKKADGALEFAKKNYPLTLKLISDELLHKSSVNGVRIVNNEQELIKNYDELLKLAKQKKLKLDGILVKEYVRGKSIIIGGKKDTTFGPIVLFGDGGIYTEVLKDFSLRICPLDIKDINEMIKETKVHSTLNNSELKHVANAISKVNEVMVKHPEISELDINPLIVNDKNAFVVDARIIMNYPSG